MSDEGQVHGPTFGKVPPELMHDPLVTDGSVRLYAHMHWRYGQNRRNFEGQQSMAEFLSVSSVTIRNRVAELEAMDWIVTVERGFNKKTGNFSTHFYHVFVSQEECRTFRETYVLQEGEVLYEKPLPTERKLRRGKGGKNNLNHANSGYVGHANSGYVGHANSGYVGHANSGYDYPDSIYPDSSHPEPNKDITAPSAVDTSKSETDTTTVASKDGEATHITDLIKAWLDGAQVIQPKAYANKTIRCEALELHNRGIVPADITAYIKSLRAQEFWVGKPIGWKQITSGIMPWKEAGKAAANNPAFRRVEAPPESDPEAIPMPEWVREQFEKDLQTMRDKANGYGE